MTRWACMRAQGRTLVYWTVYSLDAMRRIILHPAATQSLPGVNDPLGMHARAGAHAGVLDGVLARRDALHHPAPGRHAEPAARARLLHHLPHVRRHRRAHRPGRGSGGPKTPLHPFLPSTSNSVRDLL